MKLARVVGNVVATAHHPAYDGHKLMMIEGLEPDGSVVGKSTLAVDLVQAGPGDRVLVLTEGNGIRQLLGRDAGPIRSAIVGIVDHVET
jgi:ethanolamine utilization protein EutN